MSGTCFKYRNKLVLWDSGNGDPEYIFTVYPKGSRDKNGFLDGDGIEFGYNEKEDREKTLDKVKKYIDENFDKLMDCGLDTKKYKFECERNCEITKKEKNNEKRKNKV